MVARLCEANLKLTRLRLSMARDTIVDSPSGFFCSVIDEIDAAQAGWDEAHTCAHGVTQPAKCYSCLEEALDEAKDRLVAAERKLSEILDDDDVTARRVILGFLVEHFDLDLGHKVRVVRQDGEEPSWQWWLEHSEATHYLDDEFCVEFCGDTLPPEDEDEGES